jgi:GMP synthase (glutamine-hydrolysing)
MAQRAQCFPTENHIVVLDLGSQYSLLIVKTLRKQGILAVLMPGSTPAPDALSQHTRGIVISGGPASTAGAPMLDLAWFDVDVPVLGICLGFQLMAAYYGGQVTHGGEGEYGTAQLHWVYSARELTLNIPPRPIHVWMSHMDSVTRMPEEWDRLASTPACPLAACGTKDRYRLGVQFHPEVKHSQFGNQFLLNWATHVCSMDTSWTSGHMLSEIITKITERVQQEEKVLVAVSGGVDSSVTASMMVQALGAERVHCVFVDNGLLREGEVEDMMRLIGHVNPIVVDAKARFFAALAGISDPEAKRRAIGKTFIDVLQEEGKRLDGGNGGIGWLAQGTLYSDVVESMSASGEVIKTHHNVGGLPDTLGLSLIEPLRLLFKDEVRALGVEMGLPAAMLDRQPFPGPGLAIRVLGPVCPERVAIVRAADAIVRADAPGSDNTGRPLWQTFAVLLPVKAVGVMGDRRTYDNVCVLRAVCSEDAMTASLPKLGMGTWSGIADRIVREVPGINRVCFDLTSKPPGTIEWE